MKNLRKICSLLALLIVPSVAQITCDNNGIVNGSSCSCLPGFGDATCTTPACGGHVFQGSKRPLAPSTSGFGNFSTCGCPSGWRGAGCGVCQAPDSCQLGYNEVFGAVGSVSTGPTVVNTALQCNTGVRVYTSSQMSCKVINPTLQGIYPGASNLNILRTLDPALSPLSNVSYLGQERSVQAQLFYEGVEQFYCQAFNCTQELDLDGVQDSGTWKCYGLKCVCRPGTSFCGGVKTADISGPINTLDGILEIGCGAPGPEGAKCSFKQKFLQTLFGPNGLSLSECYFGECVRQNVIDGFNATAAAPTEVKDTGDPLSGGVIAGLAVLGAFILGAVAFYLWGLRAQKKARVSTVAKIASDEDRKVGVAIQWHGVGYAVPRKNHTRWWPFRGSHDGLDDGNVILDGVNGRVLPGQMMAILGPSGAGKTTLVELLAGKNKDGFARGSITFYRPDGSPIPTKPRIGFVDQADILPASLTVREALTFAARLRLPESVPDSTKIAKVFEVMSQLGIDGIADTVIGSSNGEGRGISGGEMRRVSIGLELVGQPDVLILDEPTSGLDSTSALKVVNVLRNLARDPKNPTPIIASIHQPSSKLFQIFDGLLVLSRGRTMYLGGGGPQVAEYLEANNVPCPPMYNVADHLLDLASNQPPATGVNGSQGLISYGTTLQVESGSSDETTQPQAQGTGVKVESSAGNPVTQASQELEKGMKATSAVISPRVARRNKLQTSHNKDSDFAATFLTQFQVLSGREWINLKRDKSLFVTHFAVASILGIFCGGLYFGTGITIAGFQSRVGCLFFLGSLLAFSSLSALYNIMEIKPLFLRERSGSYYSPTAWLLARFVFDVIPLRVVPTIVVSTITYWMAGLSPDAGRFFKFLLILVLFSLAMTLFNFLLATLFRNGGIAILMSSLFNLFTMTFAGFFVHLSDIPPVLRWLQWLCPLKYALEALSVNEVTGGLMIEDNLQGVPVSISAVLIMETLFNFGVNNYYRDVLVLFAFIAGFGASVIGSVWLLLKERR